MSQMEEALNELILAIKNSPEYIQYRNQCERLKKYPELEKQVHEYRKKNFEVQNETDQWNLYERVDRFDAEYADFRRNPMVSEYLAAELAFCRLIQDIIRTIHNNTEFDLGFEIE